MLPPLLDLASNPNYAFKLAERVLEEHHIPFYTRLLEDTAPYIQLVGISDDLGTLSPVFIPKDGEGSGSLVIRAGDAELSMPVTVKRRMVMTGSLVARYFRGHRTLVGLFRLMGDPLPRGAGGERVQVRMDDCSNACVYRHQGVADEEGFLLIEIPADHLGPGPYRIRADVVDRPGASGWACSFRLPAGGMGELQVALQLDRASCAPGGTVLGTVSVRTADERPVPSARLSITAGAASGDRDSTYARIDRDADGEGVYSFKFTLPSSIPGMSDFYVAVSASKGAMSGFAERELPVEPDPGDLVAVTERSALRQGVPNRVFFLSLDSHYTLSSRIVPSPEAKAASRGPGRASMVITPGDTLEEKVIVNSTGSQGKIAGKSFSFPVEKSAGAVLMRPDHYFFRKGEPLSLECFSTLPDGALYVDLLMGGAVVGTETINIRGGSGRKVIIPPQDLAGIVELRAYDTGGPSGRLADSCAVHYSPWRQGTPEIAPYRQEAVPGEMLPLAFRIPASLAKDGGQFFECALYRQGEDGASFLPAAPALVEGREPLKNRLLPSIMACRDDLAREALSLLFFRSPGDCTPCRPPLLPGVLYYEPLIRAGKDGTATVSIPLPPYNCKGEFRIRGLTFQGEAGGKVATFQPYSCEFPYFSPFITEGDFISLPVKLVNYTDKAREVLVDLSKKPWFELSGEKKKKIQLGPYGDGTVLFPFRAVVPGFHKVAAGTAMEGAVQEVRRDLAVVPRAAEESSHKAGLMTGEAKFLLHYPEGSRDRKISLVLYPGASALVLRARDGLRERPLLTPMSASSLLYTAALDREGAEKLSSAAQREREDILAEALRELRRFRRTGGGYGESGHLPGLLYTAAAIRAQKMAGVEDGFYAQDCGWLLSRRRSDGFWPGEEGASSLSLTAFIIWALGDGKPEIAGQVASKMVKEAMESKDSLSMALVLCALQGEHEQKTSCQALSRELSAWPGREGPAVKSEAPAEYGDGSLGGSLLASAFSVLAPGGELSDEGQKKTVARFLLAHALGDGTWGPSLRTPLAVEALARLYGKHSWKGTLELETGGRRSHVITVGGEDTRMYRTIDLSGALSGDTLELLMHGRGEGLLFYQISSSYLKSAPAGETATMERCFDPVKVKCGQSTRFSLTWKPGALFSAFAVLETPLPWGSSIDPGVLEEYIRNGSLLGYREKKGKLSLYVNTKANAGTFSFPVKMNVPCRVELRPAEIRDYYNDRRRERSSFSSLEVEE